MTWKDWAPRVRTFAGLLRDMLWLSGLFAPVALLLALGLYQWQRDRIVGVVRSELGIESLATEASVDALRRDVGQLTDEVRRATGEDRIIRQARGLSYVTEPVRQGEDVVLNLVIERTGRGKGCRFVGGQSLFTDVAGVAVPGSRVDPQRQVSTSQTRLRIVLEPPAVLIPGRVELYLALEYQCDGQTVFDRTDTVTYQLLPG